MTVNVSKPSINLREKISELDKPSGIAGEHILRSETPQEVFEYIGARNRNIIINGDMSIAQRGTSTASITGNGYHTIDRFNTINTTLGTWTQSQETDVPTGQGFSKSLKMACTTADASPASGDRLDIQQKFEGQMLQYLKKGTSNAESLTLSFWVKSNKTGTYIVELFDNDNARQISQAYTIDSASTWEKKTLTFSGDTSGALNNDNGSSLQVSWFLAVGNNYSSGTLSTSWTSNTNANRAVGQVNLADSTSNEWYITGVQLEVGKFATPFEFLPYDVNLDRCYRYYQKFNGGNSTAFASGAYYSSSGFLGTLKYKKTMRTIPSFQATGSFQVRSAGTNSASSIVYSGDAGLDTLSLQCTATGTAGDGGVFRTDASGGSLSLDAEL